MSRRALINGCRRSLLSPFFSISSISSSREAHTISTSPQYHTPRRTSSSSPFESNILRILLREIEYHYDYASPRQPVTEYDRFMVEDRPGEQWITLRGKSAEDENIKIEATMFDGSIVAPKSGEEGNEENVRLHICVLVDIWKGEGTDSLEFVCSAWPNSLKIQKVYIFRRDASPAHPYMGPDIKNLNKKLQSEFYNFLKSRGVDSDLSRFLHEYMANKDRIELIRWLGKVQSYLQK
ncbi:MAM33, mitochondrial matrix glycoprotein [Handroanthus impetiginosus]|uniref:MAM33, mitochondrial matrix glycoprotein n=1 Tax=Handroanthus impetiginosus TaxID=429701 RepID=A0A2G9I056_9LAMI|nr:MAM33, mitochondrial matrix glycoprotein [Handroanthus impetiginosus]